MLALLPSCSSDPEIRVGQSSLVRACLRAGVVSGVRAGAVESAGAVGCASSCPSRYRGAGASAPQSLRLPFLPVVFSCRNVSPPCEGLPVATRCLTSGTAPCPGLPRAALRLPGTGFTLCFSWFHPSSFLYQNSLFQSCCCADPSVLAGGR